MKKNKLILDEADSILIKSLQSDARQSLRTISRQTGISVPTLSMKLQRLMETGAIKSFAMIMNSDAFGFRDYVIEINLRPRYLKKVSALAGDFSHFLVTQDSRVVGIFSGTDSEVATLYTRLSTVEGVERITITPTISYEVNTAKPDIESGSRLSIRCHFCKGDISSSPVTAKHDGRMRYFCCTSCRRLFLEKHRADT